MSDRPRWAAFADVRVELGIGETYAPSTLGIWGAAHWSDPTDALWSGTEPVWVDISCHCRTVETFAGVDYTIGRFGVGTAQLVTDNADGWATLLKPNLLNVQVRRPVRITGLVMAGPAAGQGFSIFRGYIDEMTPTYLADGRPGVQFDCVDALALFAADDPLELDPPVGAGELSGVRVARILDRLGWAKTRRRLDAGQVQMVATSMARNYADELGVTADSEGGSLFIDPDGVVTFKDRDWWRLASPTIRYTIGNGSSSDLCPTGWSVGQSMGEIISLIALANEGGTVRNYRDADAFAAVGPATYRRFDLVCQDPAQLDILAGRIFEVRGGARARVKGATFSMIASGLELADVLAGWPELGNPLAFGDRLLAEYVDPTGGADSFSLATLVTRIAHRIDADGDWLLELGLEDAAPYTPARGWGSARWGIDTWTSPSVLTVDDLEAELEALTAATIGAPL
jgi:hypothetical protein